jgi:hypothetical protein
MGLALAPLPATAAADAEFFEKRIRPALVEHCHECHSAETKVRGGLSLDSRADLLKGGDSGPAIVEGKPDDSLLLAALRHRSPDLAMPAKKPKLPESLITDFAEWVRDGAVWPGGNTNLPARAGFDLAARKNSLPWIWETPRQQTVPSPAGLAPTASDVDRFLRARLAEKGIEPAPPTDDATWLRRAHFVITGLPPAPEAARAFVADSNPGKRERVVDGLLASPHYGERWARHWMDLMRYAESRGHESDYAIPNAWQYRDFLVRAFNADVPYDRFVSEHLAGDLLTPRLDPGTGANESVLGTGWVFLGEEVHSPVDIRQDECERVDNKVDVISKTFLGLTVACARCHDHKFDAISQRDYYALSGFVLSSHYRQARFETMEEHRVAAKELETLRNRHRADLAAAAAASLAPGLPGIASRLLAARQVVQGSNPEEIARTTGIAAPELSAWTNQFALAAKQATHPLHLLALASREFGTNEAPAETFRARIAALQPAVEPFRTNQRVVAEFQAGQQTSWKTDGPVFGQGPIARGEIVPGNSPTNPVARVMPYGAARRDPFWNRLAVTPGNESESGSFNATVHAGRTLLTPTIKLESGRLHYLLRGRTRVYAAVDSHIMLAGPLHGSLVATFDGGPEPTWVTHDLSGYTGHRVHIEFAPDGENELEVLRVVESPERPAARQADIAYWRPANPPGSFQELAEGFQADAIAAVGRLAQADFSQDQRLIPVADWLVRQRPLVLPSAPKTPGNPPPSASPGTPAGATAFLQAQEALAGRLRWTSRTAVAWIDGSGVDENILIRGKPSRPGEVAPRALPTAFGSPAIASPETSGRANLARQIVDRSNPLTARVMVNRIWQQVFGRGIVATPDNFGFLGERPTHPELLDHLAWQFSHQDAWSLKRLIKKLVLTDTFAQSSRAATGRAAEVDPNNTLLHRMPVRRLEAEAIRDTLLAVSGRLDPRLGGPPVPVHLTEFIIGRGRPDRSGPLDGDGRRSLYTAVPRNFLPTMMVAFDYPTPFSTVGRRNTTNVPGQPLTLMNDPFVHDQARVWAHRVIRTLPGISDGARARWMFETAFARLPDEKELQACLDTLTEVRELHASVREVDAWSELAHALFNANEFIYLN